METKFSSIVDDLTLVSDGPRASVQRSIAPLRLRPNVGGHSQGGYCGLVSGHGDARHILLMVAHHGATHMDALHQVGSLKYCYFQHVVFYFLGNSGSGEGN